MTGANEDVVETESFHLRERRDETSLVCRLRI